MGKWTMAALCDDLTGPKFLITACPTVFSSSYNHIFLWSHKKKQFIDWKPKDTTYLWQNICTGDFFEKSKKNKNK